MLHDSIWFSFFCRRGVCLVVDDVRHAYGSVVHDTLQCLLRLAGFPTAVVDMLLLAATEAIVHMGGSGGVSEALARLLAGVAQGCLASAMVFGVVAEVRAFLALLWVPPCWGPGGPFNRLGYMDDTTWCINSELDLPVFADSLQKVGLLTNLFSSGPTHASGCRLRGLPGYFPPKVCVHGGVTHARALGAGLRACGRSTSVPSGLPRGRQNETV